MTNLPLASNRIHCTGCGRLIGYAKLDQSKSGKIFCTDATCQLLPASYMHDARDDVIVLMYQRGRPTGELSKIFGVTPARINQIRNLTLRGSA